MTVRDLNEDDKPRDQPIDSTRWSVVLAASDNDPKVAGDALELLCEMYWYPVYCYVRRRVRSVDEAQDLTQGFFTKVLEKRYFADARPERGRFRGFLLTAVKHFLANERQKAAAQKRGGGKTVTSFDFREGESRYALEPATHKTAEVLFDEQWAVTLVNHVLDLLRREFTAVGKEPEFHILKQYLAGPAAGVSYARAAHSLRMTEGAVRVAVHRMRKRYLELLRKEIGQTVSSASEIDDEIRCLFDNLGR
jgi:RNA polymerase sigma-70 factor (ECF subfamily)